MSSPYCPQCDALCTAGADFCGQCGATRPQEGWPIDPLIGRLVVEAYTVIRRLGSGGFGVVYLAENVELGAKRAIKVLDARHVHNDNILRRFRREATALYRLQSPYTVRVERWGRTDDGYHFLVMEFAEGITLRKLLREKERLSEKQALTVARQTAVALADAYALEILHRDLKPENIVVRHHPHEGDRVAVLDFGISKILSDDSGTNPSGLVGTPSYMAPEQFNPSLGEENIRADLWSLGVLLYEMLVGVLPFRPKAKQSASILPSPRLDPSELTTQLSRAGAHPLTQRAVLKLLETRPADRFQTPAELLALLDEHPMWALGTGSRPDRTPPTRPVLPSAVEMADTVSTPLGVLVNNAPAKNSKRTSPATLSSQDDDDSWDFHDEPPEELRLERTSVQRDTRASRPEEPAEEPQPEPRRRGPSWKVVLVALFLLGLLAAGTQAAKYLFPEGRNDADAGPTVDSDAGTEMGSGEVVVLTYPTPLTGRDGMVLHLVLGRTLQMGTGGEGDNPAHTVMVRPFYLDQREVSITMWRACVADDSCPAREASNRRELDDCADLSADSDLPMRCVTWAGAQAYCEAVGRRLPTEAEWELAARSPDMLLEAPWMAETRERRQAPDPQLDQSPLGLAALGWGVQEWVADWYGAGFYRVSPTIDPRGTLFGTERVLRGGPTSRQRVMTWVQRAHAVPTERVPNLGFRCAMNVASDD